LQRRRLGGRRHRRRTPLDCDRTEADRLQERFRLKVDGTAIARVGGGDQAERRRAGELHPRRLRCALQGAQVRHRVATTPAAHRGRRAQRCANLRAPRVVEDLAAMVRSQLYATNARRLAIGHPRNRRRNRRRDAARAATAAAVHQRFVAGAPAAARSSAYTGAVSGRAPCHRKNDSAACSTSMPRPSPSRVAPDFRAASRNAVAALP